MIDKDTYSKNARKKLTDNKLILQGLIHKINFLLEPTHFPSTSLKTLFRQFEVKSKKHLKSIYTTQFHC